MYWITIVVTVSLQAAATTVYGLSSVGQCEVCKDAASSTGSVSVDCSYRDLQEIPFDIPSNTRNLSLNGNNISQCAPGVFQSLSSLRMLNLAQNHLESLSTDCLAGLHSLEYLYISHNKLNWSLSYTPGVLQPLSFLRLLDLSSNPLERLYTDTFAGLHSLEELYLANTSLNWNSTFMPQDVFSSLKKLEVLCIHGSGDLQPRDQYRGDVFDGLVNIKILSIDGVAKGVDFPDDFSQLRALELLSIHGKFDLITNTTLKAFTPTQLRSLYVTSGHLKNMEPLAFSDLRLLHTLDLSGNSKLGLDKAKNAWYGLASTNISTLDLSFCSQSQDEYTNTINASFFKYLERTNLTNLILEGNEIGHINESVFQFYLPKLEALSLSYNRLRFRSYWRWLMYDISQMKHLKKLALSHQLRSRYDDEPMIGLGPFIQEARYGSRLSLATDRVEQTSSLRDSLTYQYVQLPETLEELYLAESYDYSVPVLHQFTVFGTKHLRRIDLSENCIDRLEGPILLQYPQNQTWEMVSFAKNGIYEVAGNLLSSSVQYGLRVEGVDLSDNKLAEHLKNKPDGLEAFKDVKYLNLASNEIRFLNRTIFGKMSRLQHLMLAQNALRTLDFDFSHLVHLTTLDLSSNLLSAFSLEEMASLDSLVAGRHYRLYINMSDNPLICSCATVSFLAWMKPGFLQENTSTIWFSERDTYQCTLGGRLFTISDVYSRYFDDLRVKCNTPVYLKVAVGIFTVSAVAVVISIILYRHRWDIKFLVIRLIMQGKSRYQEWGDNRVSYKYDAFVSFHDDDVAWVREQLRPSLEGPDDIESSFTMPLHTPAGQPWLRLCLHYRDFYPGTSIFENITRGITGSRKVLLLVSGSFVKSQWCRYEVEAARLRNFDDGQNSIVVVMLEPMARAALPDTLQVLVRRYTYLSWPRNPRDRPRFWKKLRESIQSRHSTPTACECGRQIQSTRASGHVSV